MIFSLTISQDYNNTFKWSSGIVITLQVVVGSHCWTHLRTSPIGRKNVPPTQSLQNARWEYHWRDITRAIYFSRYHWSAHLKLLESKYTVYIHLRRWAWIYYPL